jgi:tetratricopeptide (TPR) repeat protein
MALGKTHEEEGELSEAAEAYEKRIKLRPIDEKAYDRLMIVYRKLKEYKKELAIINAGITAFETTYNKTHKAPGKKVASLSQALLKATGLVDKKGESLYQPGPLARWKKRKLVVSKRLKK